MSAQATFAKTVEERIQQQREEIFHVMALIEVVHDALDEDEQDSPRDVLELVQSRLNGIATGLEKATWEDNAEVTP